MSTYFNLYCKHKDTDEKPLLLLWLSTTPARELANEVGLKYSYETMNDIEKNTKGDIIMSQETLQEIVSYYQEQEEWLEKNIIETQDEANKLLNLLPMANSQENYDRLVEDRNSLLSSIMEDKDELQTIKKLYANFMFVQEMFDEDMNTEFELYYYLG